MRFTPDGIKNPGPDEVLVIASPAEEGLHGQYYYLPAQAGESINALRPRVDRLLDLAEEWDQTTFLITRSVCSETGLTPAEAAPLFDRAVDLYNVVLPEEFFRIILTRRRHLGLPLPEGL